MCRLILVSSKREFSVNDYLARFAEISKNSKEFQGHGWGIAYLKNGEWQIHKSINPIWESNLNTFPKTTKMIAHARSAFEDRNIRIENNMPFSDDNYLFIFNGELRGVSIKEKGRIGAEKIFNYIKRFDRGDIGTAIVKGLEIINNKSQYVRALNLIIVDKDNSYIYSQFNEDPEYFTMHYRDGAETVVCSDPIDNRNDWRTIQNGTLMIK